MKIFDLNIRRRKSAFTLVEILTATAVMLIVIIMVLHLTSNIISSWTHASGKLEKNFEARQALDMIAEDLVGAIFRNDGNAWMHIVDGKKQISNTPFLENADILYFFTSPTNIPRVVNDGQGSDTGEKILGDVSAVCYKLYRQNVFKPDDNDELKKSFGLYRAVVRPDTTFSDILGENNGIDAMSIDKAWQKSLQLLDGELKEFSGKGEDWITAPYNLIAQNIVGFDVMITGLYNTETGEIVDLVKARKKISPGNATDEYLGMYSNVTSEVAFPIPDTQGESAASDNRVGIGFVPAWIDVSVLLLSDQGEEVLRNKFKDMDSRSFDLLVEEYGTEYRRRIRVNTTPQ